MATTTPVDAPLSGGVTQAQDVITNNMPLVFGVGIAFVAWHVGKRVLGKI
jgi:phosphotransferase system  glucose/maltose/N-acetylglucosamine-specific IIC component